MERIPSVGDRLRLSGGYDFEPRWLNGRSQYLGTIFELIPGQNTTPALVVRLDEAITCDGVTGEILVLELRYEGVDWSDHNVVHVELCDFQPGSKTWKDRRQGNWIESHATCVLAPPYP